MDSILDLAMVARNITKARRLLRLIAQEYGIEPPRESYTVAELLAFLADAGTSPADFFAELFGERREQDKHRPRRLQTDRRDWSHG